MRICIKNLQELVHCILALKENHHFLMERELYDSFEPEAGCNEMKFTTKYGESSIETVVSFSIFCKAFYRLESITVNNNLIYGYCEWTDTHKQQVVIGTTA